MEKGGEGRLQIKTKHSTAQTIRNTKKKSDSGVNGITALYRYSQYRELILGPPRLWNHVVSRNQHFGGMHCFHLQGQSERGEDMIRLYNQVAWMVVTQTHGRRLYCAQSEPTGNVTLPGTRVLSHGEQISCSLVLMVQTGFFPFFPSHGSHSDPEDRGNMLLHNTYIQLHYHMVSKPSRPRFEL